MLSMHAVHVPRQQKDAKETHLQEIDWSTGIGTVDLFTSGSGEEGGRASRETPEEIQHRIPLRFIFGFPEPSSTDSDT